MPDNAAPVLILTRPAAASARFRADLALPADIEVIESPLIRIVPLSPALPAVSPAGLIVTSENGAAALARLGLPRVPVWAVGGHTAQVAERAGYSARAAGGDADSLFALLSRDRPAGPLLHLRGTHARGDLAARLGRAGIPTGELVVYDQLEEPLSPQALAALGGRRPIVMPVFSPRTAAFLARARIFAAPLHVVAISAAAAAPLRSLSPAVLTVAVAPDAASMAAATLAAVARARMG